MGKFIIEGNRPLRGTVTVSGSKNAALPVIFAAVSARGVSYIHSLPDIGDVRLALELIRRMGAVIERDGELTVIDTTEMRYVTPDGELTSGLRASTYLIGACLARFGVMQLGRFGGCNFSHRPIDLHLHAAALLGASSDGEVLTAPHLEGADVTFSVPSVGATVNFLIMAASARGVSHLTGGASEPHILPLIDFLTSAGATIEREGGNYTVIGAELSGGVAYISGDAIEAGTLLAASLLTGGEVRVMGASADELSPLLSLLSGVGVSVDTDLGVMVHGTPSLPLEVIAEPYPGFQTDLQPICAPLMAAFAGGGIEDRVWQGRYGYLRELCRHGVYYRISDRGADIYPSVLSSAHSAAIDLRGGAACVLSALASEGTSVIHSAETVLRGYERLVAKLTALGAVISYSAD